MMEFYGDETRWFIGMVVDNVDPLKLDRVKVRIHGLHENNEIPCGVAKRGLGTTAQPGSYESTWGKESLGQNIAKGKIRELDTRKEAIEGASEDGVSRELED